MLDTKRVELKNIRTTNLTNSQLLYFQLDAVWP